MKNRFISLKFKRRNPQIGMVYDVLKKTNNMGLTKRK